MKQMLIADQLNRIYNRNRQTFRKSKVYVSYETLLLSNTYHFNARYNYIMWYNVHIKRW